MATNGPALNEITKGFAKARGLMIGDGVYIFSGDEAPTNGTSGTGAGWAGTGSLYINAANGTLTQNTGTAASPTWTSR